MAEQHPAPVAIVMGSQSDWSTLSHAADTLDALEIDHEELIVSAHRTPTASPNSPRAPGRPDGR
jgi:phosphoribosylcarboxyaminoimidazole (NCAIR) mutase